jgi:HNH endonuclease
LGLYAGFAIREAGDVAARSTRRVQLAQWAKDWMWSESGGHCQNPTCRVDLLKFVPRNQIGELAHIIPASYDGPRSDEEPELSDGDRALPENILLLCPTCHTVVDKAPGAYPADVLRGWKRRSQEARAVAHGTPVFTSRPSAREFVEPLLGANRAVFDQYGPTDDVFDDDRAEQWRRHVRDTIIPNNHELLRVLAANRVLLTPNERATVDLFAIHVQELEERHLYDDWTPGSTRFPPAMESIFEGAGCPSETG